MRQVAIVVDDFYDDFAEVRRIALAAEYDAGPHGNYPGRNSRAPHITEEAERKLAAIAGARFAHLAGSGSGCFRVTTAGEHGVFDIHADRAQLSAVVYLSDADACAGRGGTSFWRHRRTGLVGIPEPADEATCVRVSNEVIIPDSNHRDRWDQLLEVQMVPNRMILFPSRMFHAPQPGFGTGPADGRLVQMFFLLRDRG